MMVESNKLNILVAVILALFLPIAYAIQAIMDAPCDGGSYIGGVQPTHVDFPISDIQTKEEYTNAFTKVYNSDEKPPIVAYSDIDGQLKYTESQEIYTGAFHNGQRKLFLNELQFLTGISAKKNSVVVYAGAAPSNKGAFLASLFPNIKFILIDPARFDIRPYGDVRVQHLPKTIADKNRVNEIANILGHSNICTVNAFMTSKFAEELGSAWGRHRNGLPIPGFDDPDLYFISDIRTTSDGTGPSSFDMIWNSAQQMDWHMKLQPVASMFKFRLPFWNESPDILKKFLQRSKMPDYAESFDNTASVLDFREMFNTKKFVFYCGDLLLQPWAPISSTEMRLIVSGDGKIQGDGNKKNMPCKPIDDGPFGLYELNTYENTMFYYNKILRNFQLYSNPHADRKIGFDHCIDCALENLIWTNYCISRDSSLKGDRLREKVINYVNILSRLTFRNLLLKYHGHMFGKIPISELLNRFEKYRDSNRESSFNG